MAAKNQKKMKNKKFAFFMVQGKDNQSIIQPICQIKKKAEK
jgi:hypothetical protein